MIDSYKAGDLDACLEMALQLLQDNPDSISALQYAARVHSKRRAPQLAKPYWNKLTVLAPALPEPFLQSARIARLEKDWATCERYIDEFIRHDPAHPEALGIQVQCYLDKNDAEKTARALSRLAQVNPKAVPPLAIRAVEHGMGIDVAHALSKPADAGDPSLTDLRDKLARSARDAAIGFEIGKDPFAAAQCYRALQIYAPHSSYPTNRLNRLSKPYLKKAQAAYREKLYEDAVKHARTCIELAPDDAVPYIIAGRSSAQLGLHQQAFTILSQNIEPFWSNSWLLLNYARAAMKLGKSARAYAAFRAIRARDDEKSQAFAAECDKQLARISEAAEAEILALLDKNLGQQACDKIFAYQDSGLELPDLPMLVGKLREMGHKRLAMLVAQDDSAAQDYAISLVRLDPEDSYACGVAGRALMSNHEYEKAFYYWTQMHNMAPESTEPLLNLARCYAKLNNKAEAVKAANAVLLLDPNHEEGKHILQPSNEMKSLRGEGAV